MYDQITFEIKCGPIYIRGVKRGYYKRGCFDKCGYAESMYGTGRPDL